ncbi:MAG: 2-phosphosulfolactate phosphatase [Armatimonadetes bacterium]|nr:2-phosphosulfolactate phosphatase [Armatimonadota bacterium]
MTELDRVPVRVYNTVPGAQYAASQGLVCVVVDALRASATIASLLAAGAERVLVTAEPTEAFAVADAVRGGGEDVILVGERNAEIVPGFHRGNEPVVGERLSGVVVFTSSNCAACCTAAASAPALFIGSTVNASSVARAAAETAIRHGTAVGLIMGGFSWVPARLSLEDLLACGAIIDRGGLEPDNDAARAALFSFRYVTVAGIERQFRNAEHSELLARVGRQADIRFCARVDHLHTVPVRTAVLTIAGFTVVELRANEQP